MMSGAATEHAADTAMINPASYVAQVGKIKIATDAMVGPVPGDPVPNAAHGK